MNIHRRIIIGVLIAPLSAALPAVAVSIVSGVNWKSNLVAILPFTYLFAFIMGIPMLILLHRSNVSGFWKYCLAGALAGAVSLLLFAATSETAAFNHILWLGKDMLIFAMHGAIVAMTFWIIAFWRNETARPPIHITD